MASQTAVFGLQLFAELVKLGALDSSVGGFISPLSAFLAFVLALNGAGPTSQTHQQLWTLLTQQQLPTTVAAATAAEADFNAQTAAIMSQLNSQSGVNGSKLIIANALWTNQTPLNPEYANSMMQLFQAPVTEVNSTAPINAWASNSTNGLIKKAIPDGMEFQAVITNAVYFKGAWVHTFDKGLTDKANFTTPSKTVTQVDMMQKSFKEPDVYWAESAAFRALKLPYVNSTIKAIAVLANRDVYGLDADAALADIGVQTILSADWQATSSAPGRGLSVRMPKFKVKSEVMSLKEALQALNVTDAFTYNADFSRLSADSLKISDVLQSVVVIVDEEGTEAAAVTSITGASAAPPGPEPPLPLLFDRPFVFMLVDESSGAVLFLGTVRDPTGTSTYKPSEMISSIDISKNVNDSADEISSGGGSSVSASAMIAGYSGFKVWFSMLVLLLSWGWWV